MTLADLQSNISISANNAVTGDIEFCTGYTGFSDNIGEQAGWYLALKVSTSAEGSALEGATITATYAGTVRTLEDGETFIVRLAEGEDSITFTANKEGYTEGRLTLDLSGLDKEALTQNILYTASLTNGVTVSPLQFGESKTITGQVPWDTTVNANTFNISMRPFEMVAPGTPWSIAFNGVELAEGEFSLITPESGSPYSFATAKLAVTQEMISAQSPYLVVTVRPDSGDPVDAFYSSMNIGGLTLEAAPLEALWYNLTGSKTYNDVTYTNEDLITGGTITRDANTNTHKLNNIHFKWHPEFLDNIWDTNGYGIILTTNDSAYAEYYRRAIPMTELRFTDNVLTEKNEWYTLPHSYLVKYPQGGAIASIRWRASDGSTTREGQGSIYPQSLTYESDPRSIVPATVTYLQEGNYNNIPITSYFTAINLGPNEPVTLYDQSGYYIFLKIATSESDLSIRFTQQSVNNFNPISYTDVTSDITGITLGSNDIILKLDISTLNITNANTGIALQLAKQGFRPNLNAFAIPNNVYNLSTYTNGLTGRNIGISPLSSTVKAAGFGDYCDINFTPIDPATATVVNDEVTISVSGTLKKKSTQTSLAAPSTDYLPMYKNYTNIGQNMTENISLKMNMDANYYYIIFEAENIIPVNSGTWKCSGVSGGNESSPPVTNAELRYPMIINGTSHKAIWAIHIPENQTSLSIHCIPTNKNEFTEVTYNFDLTNVTYGTIS